MRTASLRLMLAAGACAAATAAATASGAQAPAPATPPAPPATAASPAVTTPVPPAAAPAAAAPETPPNPAEAPPTLPTEGDGAAIINVLEKVCVPLVRGGNLDQLVAQLPNARKNRRDNSWSAPLAGDKAYTISFLPQGVNKDVCQAEVHFAVGQDAPIVKAINIWSFLHRPELILQANYVAVEGDGVKRVRKSWEHLESNSSTAVNFTTWRKPDDSSLNKNYDTGYLFYQERKF